MTLQENFNSITNILILILVFFGGIVWADTNGIWQEAQDLRGGTIGSDEQNNQSYTFINPVYFLDKVGIGTTNPTGVLDVNGTIKSSGPLAGIQFQDRVTGSEGFQWWSSGGTARLYDHNTNTDRLIIESNGDLTIDGQELATKAYVNANSGSLKQNSCYWTPSSGGHKGGYWAYTAYCAVGYYQAGYQVWMSGWENANFGHRIYCCQG